MTTVENEALAAQWAAWHAEREDALRDPHGWLGITALHWLDETPRSFPDVPGEWSTDGVSARNGTAEYTLAEAASTLVDGADGVKVEVVLRTGRYGLRVRDPKAEDLVGFTGVPAFDVRPEWIVDAEFEAFDEPRPIVVGAARDGLEHHLQAVGIARFEVAGEPQQLLVHASGDGVQVLFHDATNGDTTAPWRSLSPAGPQNGRLRLDFNRSVNLPAGLTPYGTCPRPPAENVLTVPVEAGERRFR
ncbi:hypothetical protein FHS29_000637 [Saccharothrix tamanrassetensis]|uniref:DUF1684 domain-containing protein n=1 Tax=Saccharothrix tamanrassetensis TaxID=1051531 RepID=A0A841CD16_9PSEU|nr:DUF1684 domain-containing protein [Saccharothrix tamanrassetensis]MBB5954067.1 hypothetical protein [Saccharothrix tamanrassetensis]